VPHKTGLDDALKEFDPETVRDQIRDNGEAVEAYGETWSLVDLVAVAEAPRADGAPSILERTDGRSLLYAGKMHLLSGPYESLKTWLALRACAGQIARGHHVLFIDFEDDAPVILERLADMGIPLATVLELFHYARPDEPLASRNRVESVAMARLDATIGAYPYTLAVLDGLTEALALHGISMNDNTDVARFMGLVPRRLQRAGMAVLTLDHTPHEGGRAIGAQHKVAGLDGAAYLLEPVRMAGRDDESVARLTVKKDRPGYVRSVSVGGKATGEVHVGRDEHGFVTVTVDPSPITRAADDPLGLRPAERRVFDALGEESEARTPSELVDRVVEQGWTAGLRRETIQRALAVLQERELADGADGRWWCLSH
jgi:AAA domain